MALSRAGLGAWVAVAIVATGCGRVAFESHELDPLATPEQRRVVVAALGSNYLVAWASVTSPDAPLEVRLFCP